MGQPTLSESVKGANGRYFPWAEVGHVTKNEHGVSFCPVQWDFPEGQRGPSGEKLRTLQYVWGLQKEEAIGHNGDASPWVKGASDERPAVMGFSKEPKLNLNGCPAHRPQTQPARQFQSHENFSVPQLTTLALSLLYSSPGRAETDSSKGRRGKDPSFPPLQA